MLGFEFLALASTASFALGAQAFFTIGKKANYLWINVFKTLLAFFIFGGLFLYKAQFVRPDLTSFSHFFISGFIGLGLADIFLLKAFLILKPARALTLASFQPIIVGILSYHLLGHSFAWEKLFGILCFILCSIVIGLEKSDRPKTDILKGILFSFIGLFLNSFSCILTRMGCDQSPLIDSIEGNLIRVLGALFCFIIFRPFLGPVNLINVFKKFNQKEKFLIFGGSFFATVLSLVLYISAVKKGNLTTITAIGLSLPLFSFTLEAILERKKPSKAILMSLFFFILGASFTFN